MSGCIETGFVLQLLAKRQAGKAILKCRQHHDGEVWAISSCHVGPPSMGAPFCPVVHLLAKAGQGVEACIGLQPDIASSTAIAPCWPTCTPSQTLYEAV